MFELRLPLSGRPDDVHRHLEAFLKTPNTDMQRTYIWGFDVKRSGHVIVRMAHRHADNWRPVDPPDEGALVSVAVRVAGRKALGRRKIPLTPDEMFEKAANKLVRGGLDIIRCGRRAEIIPVTSDLALRTIAVAAQATVRDRSAFASLLRTGLDGCGSRHWGFSFIQLI